VGILMMPLVPGITTSRRAIERTVEAIARSGVPLAGAGVAHLEAGVREHFFGFLERDFPSLLAGYERLYAGAYARADYVSAVKASIQAARRTVSPGPEATTGAPEDS
jgi:DNA repair photolyase